MAKNNAKEKRPSWQSKENALKIVFVSEENNVAKATAPTINGREVMNQITAEKDSKIRHNSEPLVMIPRIKGEVVHCNLRESNAQLDLGETKNRAKYGTGRGKLSTEKKSMTAVMYGVLTIAFLTFPLIGKAKCNIVQISNL